MSLRKSLPVFLFLGALFGLKAGLLAQDAAVTRDVLLVPLLEEASWHDHVFLASLAMAQQLEDQGAYVLAVDANDPWRPEVLDFLKRLQPTSLTWVGHAPTSSPSEELPKLQFLVGQEATELSLLLANQGWEQIHQVVVYRQEDPAAALVAATLAMRLRCPLLPLRKEGIPSAYQELWNDDALEQIFAVGDTAPKKIGERKTIRLQDGNAVSRWLTAQGHTVEYLAVVQPHATSNLRNRSLSLVAPMLAGRHQGMVLPLPSKTQWKQVFPADEILEKAPGGGAASSSGWRRGTLTTFKRSYPFLLGKSADTQQWWVQVDRNRDGSFRGKKEQPISTAQELELDGVRYSVDLDADENRRGQALWLTSPTPSEVQALIHEAMDAADAAPTALCLVGWPDAVPMAVIAPGQGIDADLVSDLPYAQLDDDPFFELGLARFLAEDLVSATLLATRGFARAAFPDAAWRGRFITAEWEEACRLPMQAAGMEFHGHHAGGNPLEQASTFTEVAAIIQASHASWAQMGETYLWNTETLLAPALVESAGCSTASLDQDPDQKSVAACLLKNGAVAFVGNTRRGIAQQDLFRSEFWNALHAGASLGEAQRFAQNRVLVAVLDKGQEQGGSYFYQLYNHAVYGDPALQLGFQQSKPEQSTQVHQKGNTVTLAPPTVWHRYSYVPLEEWGCTFPLLYAWRGAGVGVESTWYGPEKRNAEDYMFTAEVRTSSKVKTVKPLDKIAETLGWSGTCYVDHHADGTRSLFWRVRMLDADMTTGEIRAQWQPTRFRMR